MSYWLIFTAIFVGGLLTLAAVAEDERQEKQRQQIAMDAPTPP